MTVLTRHSTLLLALLLFPTLVACGDDADAKADFEEDDAASDSDEAPQDEDEDEDEDEDDEDPAGKRDAGKPDAGKADASKPPPSNGGKPDAGSNQADSGKSDAASDDDDDDDDDGDDGPALSGECCDDGDCLCRGGDPTDATVEGIGPYKVAKYTSGFAPVAKYAGATIYYPEDADAPFSAIVLCPGFTAVQDAIADYGTFFASHGIVTMIIDTFTILDFVPERAPQLLEALSALKAENERDSSPLKGKLTKDRYGLGGWSMGGGATWIATGDHPELKSGFTIAGHHATAGGAAAVATKIAVPTLMLAAENDDDLIPLGGANQSQDAFTTIPESTPKLMYEMAGLDHFGINSPIMNKQAAHYSLAFEKTFLDGDTRYRKFLLTKPSNATDWMSNIE